jgi:ankyrin repeat protein
MLHAVVIAGGVLAIVATGVYACMRFRQKRLIKAGFAAARAEDVHNIRAAIASGFPLQGCDSRGFTLLHCVALRPSLHVLLPEMLAKGWDPNAETPFGSTPVHCACVSGSLPAVQTLLQAGGCLDSISHTGSVAHSAVWAVLYKPNKANSLQLLNWLATRDDVDWLHACDYDGTTALTSLEKYCDEFYADHQHARAIVVDAMVAHKARARRWSAPRTAFIWACVAN